jgi:CRISPR-associated protein (TIGR03984 family)
MSQTALFVHRCGSCSLGRAVTGFAGISGSDPAIALLYSPGCCRFARLGSDGVLKGPDGRAVDLAAVFEARLFNEKAELRWLNDPGPEQQHRAVILTTEDLSEGLGDHWSKDSHTPVESLSNRYLLWGEGTGRLLADGWSELATARIGALPVPVAGVGARQRVLLQSAEYLAEVEDGNVVVLDERLCKLEVERG